MVAVVFACVVRWWVRTSDAWRRATLKLRKARRERDEAEASCRDLIVDELMRAEAGEPRLTSADVEMAGSAAAARSAVRVRAVRSGSTNSAAARAVRYVREFVLANPAIAARSGRPDHNAYDTVIEAFVWAEEAGVAGKPCPWVRARRRQDPSAARSAGAARALLERLGWSRGAMWVRSRGMERAWTVRDDSGSRLTPPIFAWELVEGFRLRAPRTPWELAGAAMAVLGATHAKRGGGVKLLKVGEVSRAGDSAVVVRARVKVKARASAAGQGASGARAATVVLRHWLIRKHVLPWLQWHERHASPGSALLFPSITAKRSPAPTPLGFEAEGKQWVEPLRQWSARQVHEWLNQFVPNLGPRAFHGFRAGNNRELRRSKEVHDVTRRALHERSLKPAIGSEAHYDETFAEDFAAATERLGQLRIERDDASGLLTVTATSASAGELDDWVPVKNPIALQAPTDGGHDSDSSSSEGSDDSGSGGNAVGDGGKETRAYNCGRCGVAVGARDYGFMCEVQTCTWGTCTTCHPGGARASLYCPEHDQHSER